MELNISIEIAVIITTAIAIDFIKSLWEMRFMKKPEKIPGKQDPFISVLITGINEELSIGSTIESLIRAGFNRSQIFFANDGSTDNSEKVALALLPKRNVFTEKNVKKPRAMKAAVYKIAALGIYKYILPCDADLDYSIDSGIIDVKAFEQKDFVGMAFNIVPVVDPKNKGLCHKTVVDVQKIEYAVAMMISRNAASKNGNIHCASGAFSLWKIDAFLEILEYHDMVFTGDDQQTTLIAQRLGYKVGYDNNIIVFTHAPSSITALYNQRVNRWWPGLWKNMKHCNKIIFSNRYNFRLRSALAFETLVNATDPLKMASIMYLIMGSHWQILGILYTIYIIFGFYVNIQMMKREMLEPRTIKATLYLPFYSVFQMIARMHGLVNYIIQKFFKNDWKKAQKKITFGLFLLFGSILYGQEQAPDSLKISKKYFKIESSISSFDQGDSNNINWATRLGYRNNFLTLTTQPLNTVTIGRYQKIKFNDSLVGVLKPVVSYRYKNPGGSIGMVYTHWWKKKIIPFIGITSYFNGRPNDINGENVQILNLGSMYFHKERFFYSLSIFQDLSNVDKTTILGHVKYTHKNFFVSNYTSIGTYKTYGTSLKFGYKKFFLFSSYNKKIDFTNQNQFIIGSGFKFKI